jgi:hypothetical protein
MPEGFERSLMNKVDETIDPTIPIAPEQNMGMEPVMETPGMQDQIMQGQTPTKMNYGLDNPFNQPKSEPKSQAFRTPQQPSAKVDSGAFSTAKRTVQSGIDSVKRLFS